MSTETHPQGSYDGGPPAAGKPARRSRHYCPDCLSRLDGVPGLGRDGRCPPCHRDLAQARKGRKAAKTKARLKESAHTTEDDHYLDWSAI